MSPLAEQIVGEIRTEVAKKIEWRERMFDPQDSFTLTKYFKPRVYRDGRTRKNVDGNHDKMFNRLAGKSKMAGRPAIDVLKLRRSIRNKNKKPMLKTEIGDFLMYGGEWQMVFSVSEGQSKLTQTNGKVTIVNRVMNDTFLKQHLGQAGLENFLQTNNLTLEQLNNVPASETKDDSNMKANTKKKLEEGKKSSPRGGLAAEVAARKAQEAKGGNAKASEKPSEILAQSQSRTKGRLGQLFGFSVVRCVAAAGKAGATFEQTMAALKKNSINAKESTVKQNLRLGKTGKIIGAELTEAQLAEFLAV